MQAAALRSLPTTLPTAHSYGGVTDAVPRRDNSMLRLLQTTTERGEREEPRSPGQTEEVPVDFALTTARRENQTEATLETGKTQKTQDGAEESRQRPKAASDPEKGSKNEHEWRQSKEHKWATAETGGKTSLRRKSMKVRHRASEVTLHALQKAHIE